jgi:hypothetical protein
LDKLSFVNCQITPCIKRENSKIIARKVIFNGGDEGYFIVNTDGKTASDTVTLKSDLTPYKIDLHSGEAYTLPHERHGDEISFNVDLLRGEAIMIFLSDREQAITKEIQTDKEYPLEFDHAYINREYSIKDGPHNDYFADGERPMSLGEWEKHFSGEVTYIFRAEYIESGDYMLDLGAVRHFAQIYVNGKKVGEKTMPPYRIRLDGLKSGDEIKIRVANTIANVCHDAKLFDTAPTYDVGPYHEHMIKLEKNAPAGGLWGEVKIIKIEN